MFLGRAGEWGAHRGKHSCTLRWGRSANRQRCHGGSPSSLPARKAKPITFFKILYITRT